MAPSGSIFQYWHSPEIPAAVTERTATFSELNPGFHHRLLCEDDAAELIATHFNDREVAAFRACAVPAMQADYFRYCALHALGGIYSDDDYDCVQALGPILEAARGGMLATGDGRQLINAILIFAAPGHPLLRLAIDIATANIERRVEDQVAILTGPVIFRSLGAIYSAGSIEAAERRFPYEKISRHLREAMAMAGSQERIDDAFEGVSVIQHETMQRWISRHRGKLPHKGTHMDWVHWRRNGASIFRD
jgi:mannosyltransferase OCH1-like enzyme